MASETMEYRRLAGTDMNLSVISLGSLGFCRADRSAEEIRRITERALDEGVNFIDTAYAYESGRIEKALGPIMESRRHEVHVLTRSHMREPEEFKESLEGSFERLRTDYIDIFQLHDVSSRELYEQLLENGVYDILMEKVDRGRIGHAGISTHGSGDLMEEMVTSGRFSVVTVAYNLTGTKRQRGDDEFVDETARRVLPLAREENVGITVMKPFGGGTLCREAPDGTRLSAVDCLLYVKANPLVTTISPGVNSMEQLEEDLSAGRTDKRLTDEQIEELEQQAQKWGRYFCRQCGYCMPCAVEIDIPAVMDALETYEADPDDGQTVESARESYAELNIPPSECIECGECEEKCPYSLPIIDRMQKAARVLE